MTKTSEAKALVRFESSGEHGWKFPLRGEKILTPIKIDETYHDACFYLGDREAIERGELVLLGVDFLAPEVVIPKLFPGKKFTICNGSKPAGSGEIVQVSKV